MDKKNNKVWAIVPASDTQQPGVKVPRQYLPLAGRTVLEISLEKLLALDLLEGVVVAISANDIHWQKTALVNHPRVYICLGRTDRSESVLNALKLVAEYASAGEHTHILVHDPLRPCVSSDKIENLIDLCSMEGTGGILAVPVSDELKRVNSRGEVAGAEDKSGLWLAHSPQCFPLVKLRSALQYCREKSRAINDEAAAIKQVGGRVTVVRDRYDNIRVTRPDDIPWAEKILLDQGYMKSDVQ